MKQKAEEIIQQLGLELETGGNIRFESGSAVDVWYERTEFVKTVLAPNVTQGMERILPRKNSQ